MPKVSIKCPLGRPFVSKPKRKSVSKNKMALSHARGGFLLYKAKMKNTT